MNANNNDRLQNLAVQIAAGDAHLCLKDLLYIVKVINFSSFKRNFLPKSNLAHKSPSKSKHYSLQYVDKLWENATPEALMELESGWLKISHKKVGSSKNDSKDVPADLVTPQILARIISLAYFIHRIETGAIKMSKEDSGLMVKEALVGLNIFLDNCTMKGRVRVTKVKIGKKKINSYNAFMSYGILPGYYGKFLPCPEVSLPYIFSLLHRDALRPEVYKK